MQWIERNKLKIYKKIIHPLKVGKAKQDMNRKKRERERVEIYTLLQHTSGKLTVRCIMYII